MSNRDTGPLAQSVATAASTAAAAWAAAATELAQLREWRALWLSTLQARALSFSCQMPGLQTEGGRSCVGVPCVPSA